MAAEDNDTQKRRDTERQIEEEPEQTEQFEINTETVAEISPLVRTFGKAAMEDMNFSMPLEDFLVEAFRARSAKIKQLHDRRHASKKHQSAAELRVSTMSAKWRRGIEWGTAMMSAGTDLVQPRDVPHYDPLPSPNDALRVFRHCAEKYFSTPMLHDALARRAEMVSHYAGGAGGAPAPAPPGEVFVPQTDVADADDAAESFRLRRSSFHFRQENFGRFLIAHAVPFRDTIEAAGAGQGKGGWPQGCERPWEPVSDRGSPWSLSRLRAWRKFEWSDLERFGAQAAADTASSSPPEAAAGAGGQKSGDVLRQQEPQMNENEESGTGRKDDPPLLQIRKQLLEQLALVDLEADLPDLRIVLADPDDSGIDITEAAEEKLVGLGLRPSGLPASAAAGAAGGSLSSLYSTASGSQSASGYAGPFGSPFFTASSAAGGGAVSGRYRSLDVREVSRPAFTHAEAFATFTSGPASVGEQQQEFAGIQMGPVAVADSGNVDAVANELLSSPVVSDDSEESQSDNEQPAAFPRAASEEQELASGALLQPGRKKPLALCFRELDHDRFSAPVTRRTLGNNAAAVSSSLPISDTIAGFSRRQLDFVSEFAGEVQLRLARHAHHDQRAVGFSWVEADTREASAIRELAAGAAELEAEAALRVYGDAVGSLDGRITVMQGVRMRLTRRLLLRLCLWMQTQLGRRNWLPATTYKRMIRKQPTRRLEASTTLELEEKNLTWRLCSK